MNLWKEASGGWNIFLNGIKTHCSKLEIVLNENDTPQNQQFLLVYTLVLPKESRLQKSVDIQG